MANDPGPFCVKSECCWKKREPPERPARREQFGRGLSSEWGPGIFKHHRCQHCEGLHAPVSKASSMAPGNLSMGCGFTEQLKRAQRHGHAR